MPEIKIKHIVSFSSEDKVHKVGNLLKPETYRKWKCAEPGEKKAVVVLQFEKAEKIHSVDIGNEHSAFVEVLAGRSSDSSNDFQVLLTTSSFMSPLESRNSTNTNRVRMFGPEKLAHNVKDGKWDSVQVVCTQPFNKNVQYGLSFIKFSSPPEPHDEELNKAESQESNLSLGKFKLKGADEEKTSLPIGNWFQKMKEKGKDSPSETSASAIRQASSFASATLANMEKFSPTSASVQKKKMNGEKPAVQSPQGKTASPVTHVNREKVGYKRILDDDDDNLSDRKSPVPKKLALDKDESFGNKTSKENFMQQKLDKPGPSKNRTKERTKKGDQKKPLNRIMENVVFVLSGFQNPLRSEIRDCALEMGAKYKGDWDSTCTHLVCAFINTPKYVQVHSKGGRIVKKDWIFDCRKKKELLNWRNYALGKPAKESEEEEDEEDGQENDYDDHDSVDDEDWEEEARRKKILPPKERKDEQKPSPSRKKAVPSSVDAKPSNEVPVKASLSPRAECSDRSSGSETEAEEDYYAKTDVDSDSGGDTEDEIRKFQKGAELRLSSQSSPSETKAAKQKNSLTPVNGDLSGGSRSKSGITEWSKPDTKDLPLPSLPDFFKGKLFLLYGEFSEKERHDLERYITAYNGLVADYMGENVKYVVTKSKWSDHFDKALSENENLIFVRPSWVYRCHQSGKFVPFQPHIIVPD